MSVGEIIYHDELIYINGYPDKKEKRHCIYLFSEEREDGEYIYSVPITSKTKTFNKGNGKTHMLIPTALYNYKTLNFAKIDNLIVSKADKVISTGVMIDKDTILKIIDKVITVDSDRKELLRFKTLVAYLKLFEELEKREEIQLKKQRISE